MSASDPTRSRETYQDLPSLVSALRATQEALILEINRRTLELTSFFARSALALRSSSGVIDEPTLYEASSGHGENALRYPARTRSAARANSDESPDVSRGAIEYSQSPSSSQVICFPFPLRDTSVLHTHHHGTSRRSAPGRSTASSGSPSRESRGEERCCRKRKRRNGSQGGRADNE